MRTIVRTPAPNCLAAQSGEWDTFMGTPCHGAVGAHLRREQQGLCCYCESRVADGHGHIEHMEPRRHNPARTYDGSNLAISCNGGRVEHCGRYKDDRHKNPHHAWDARRFAPPHDPATVGLFQYVDDGSIRATAADPSKAEYMIGYLGLNCARLSERRKQHASELLDALGEEPDPNLVTFLRQYYLDAAANGPLQPFYSLSRTILEPSPLR